MIKIIKTPALEILDPLYKEVISSLPVTARRAYCQRLIARCEFDLKHPESNKEDLKLMIKAAKKECKRL